MVSPYIYNLIGFKLFRFAPNNSFTITIKKIDGHVAQNWTLIEIQFRIYLDLNSSIFVLNNSFGAKKRKKEEERTHGTQLDSN